MFAGDLAFDENFSLYLLNDTLSCHRSVRNAQFIDAIDRSLRRLIAERRIDEIYKRYLLVPEPGY